MWGAMTDINGFPQHHSFESQLVPMESTVSCVPCYDLVHRLVRLLDRVKGANAVRVVMLIAAMTMLAHWIACVWCVSAHAYLMFQQCSAMPATMRTKR